MNGVPLSRVGCSLVSCTQSETGLDPSQPVPVLDPARLIDEIEREMERRIKL